jgi:hypothetical protein
MRANEIIYELSTDALARYKKAAGADAKKSDAEGNYARGDKRFKGINKATNKQFDNDLKKHKEQGVAEGSLNEGQYEMMMRNGQVKRFIAKDDADAKRIAAGHGAKSVIKLRGGVPAGKIAEQGVAENYHSDLMKQTYAKFFKPAPPKTVLAVKKFLSGVIISLGTAQDNDYDEEEPEEISWEQDLADVREAYGKLRGNSSPNWFDVADAVLSYDTEFRESMIEWAEEELGNKFIDFLWDEVWEAKNQISRSDGSYNVALGHQNVPGQKSDRDSFKDWNPETDPPKTPRNIEWKVMINGEQKIKFGGVSNNQEAAMKTATNWANNHGYEREVQAGKVKVVQVQQGVVEIGNNYHANTTGFAKPKRDDDERHDLDVVQSTIYGLKINGQIWKKNGHVVTFATREKALAARNSLMAKRPDLEVGLVQKGSAMESATSGGTSTGAGFGGSGVAMPLGGKKKKKGAAVNLLGGPVFKR